MTRCGRCRFIHAHLFSHVSLTLHVLATTVCASHRHPFPVFLHSRTPLPLDTACAGHLRVCLPSSPLSCVRHPPRTDHPLFASCAGAQHPGPRGEHRGLGCHPARALPLRAGFTPQCRSTPRATLHGRLPVLSHRNDHAQHRDWRCWGWGWTWGWTWGWCWRRCAAGPARLLERVGPHRHLQSGHLWGREEWSCCRARPSGRRHPGHAQRRVRVCRDQRRPRRSRRHGLGLHDNAPRGGCGRASGWVWQT